MVVYDEGPWWRTASPPLTGAVMSTKMPPMSSDDQSDAIGPMTCMDHGTFADSQGVLMCWIEGQVNNQFMSLLNDTQAREDHILDFLETALDDPRVRSPGPSQVVAHNWADQPFVRGAYTGFFQPGVQSQRALWESYLGGSGLGEKTPSLPNLFVAGSDWWPGFGNGYIEGAVRHGEAVASEIASREAQKLT